jgi:hypothetical protein
MMPAAQGDQILFRIVATGTLIYDVVRVEYAHTAAVLSRSP